MKKISWKYVAPFASAGVVGAGSMILYLSVRNSFGFNLPPWPVSIISFSVALLGAIAFHEAGHVVAGLCVKYRFFFVSVGPFKLEKTASGFKLRLDLKSPNLFGGLTLMLPDEKNESRRSAAWFIGGGPIASLLLFLLLGIAAFGLYGYGGTSGLVNALIYISWLTAVVSLTLGLLALIPESSGQIKSDGYHLQSIRKGSGAFLASRSMTRLIAQSLQGTRPADLDSRLMLRLLEADETFETQIARLFLYSHHADKGEMQTATEYLDAAVAMAEQTPTPPLDPSIFLEKAFWEVLINGNAEKAQYYFDKGKSGYSEKSTISRAEAALLFIQGKHKEALEAAETARKHIRESMDRGGAVWEDAMLNLLTTSNARTFPLRSVCSSSSKTWPQ